MYFSWTHHSFGQKAKIHAFFFTFAAVFLMTYRQLSSVV